MGITTGLLRSNILFIKNLNYEIIISRHVIEIILIWHYEIKYLVNVNSQTFGTNGLKFVISKYIWSDIKNIFWKVSLSVENLKVNSNFYT